MTNSIGSPVKILFMAALLAAVPSGNPAAAEHTRKTSAASPVVVITTNLGDIVIELYHLDSPKTVTNFLNYVDSHFYNGLIFHRVIDDFMIQAGGYWPDHQPKQPSQGNVTNESGNGLKNKKGTIAMARLTDPDSARSQFFINLRDNPHLNASEEGPGYTVFGRVTKGLNVVEAIAKVPVQYLSPQLANAPETAVQILSMARKENIQ